MSEKRKKMASFCLKTVASETVKVELFDAEQWADGRRGMVRLRVNGRWWIGADGETMYFNAAGVAAFVQRLLYGTLPEAAPRPSLRVGSLWACPAPRMTGMASPGVRRWGALNPIARLWALMACGTLLHGGRRPKRASCLLQM